MITWPLRADLRLNELVAANTSSLPDEKGAFHDWIELYNPGPEAIDLTDWTLTDNLEQPKRWTLPSHNLPPESYLLIFASGKDRSDTEIWHTNFKLASDGESLGISNPQGEVVSAIVPSYPKLARDYSYGYDDARNDYRLWRTPTPGSVNREDPNLGPSLFNPKTASLLAKEGEAFVLSIQVFPNGSTIKSVRLDQRIMHKGTTGIPLKDNGVAPDETANDGRYTGEISPSTLFGKRFVSGDMIRWAFRASDANGRETRLPEFSKGASTQAEYFGTLAASPSIDTPLPIMHWFTADPNAAASTSGTRASVFFDGRFYDNVFVKRRGQSGAISWPKPKLKFDFNPQDHFQVDPDRRLVEEFNLQAHFNDASFMRENVAFEFFNEIGTPASATQHWHVRLNGQFHGLFSYIEQVDEDFLRQQGLDPGGALYKANGFPSTLAKGVTEALYQKDTRKNEPYDDLIAFVNGINSSDRFDYIMDHVNLPAMINEMAGQSLIRNADRLTKNYYVYRDPTTDLWQRIPWDMDGAFSTSSSLANENYASPLYGDSQHTQAPNQLIYQNFLLDAILDHKLTREMYLRRLRTLIDTYLSEDYAYFHNAIDQRLSLVQQDALRDAEKWKTGNLVTGTNAIKDSALSLRRVELLETYGKDLIPDSQSAGLNLEIGEVNANPEDPKSEYFQIRNPNREAIDLSGWRLAGAVTFDFPSGTVIPRKGTLFSPDNGILHLVRDVRAFRDRSESPHGNEGWFFVGPYNGKLSSRGETIQLFDASDQLVVKHQFPATAINYASWAATQFPNEALLDETISGWAADPHEQGVSNLHRYAFGSDPQLSIESVNVITYRRTSGTSDLVFSIETSQDLITWTTAEDVTNSLIETTNGFDYKRLSFSLSHDLFVRVRVEL